MKVLGLIAAAAVAAFASAPAFAADVFVGGYAHGIGTKQGQEGGADVMVGVRSERMDNVGWLGRPSVHAFLSGNTKVNTNFAVVGLNWPLKLYDTNFYIRPGFGLAYTTGEADIGNAYEPGISAAEKARRLKLTSTRIDFGSKVLFEPELALGYNLSDTARVELSYVHFSNGQILHHGKNQGLDDLGLRIAYSF